MLEISDTKKALIRFGGLQPLRAVTECPLTSKNILRRILGEAEGDSNKIE